MKRSNVFLIVLLLVSVFQIMAQATKSRGALMFPHASEISQPDGSSILLKGNGDGVVHWLSTEQGYTVLEAESGWYEYATNNTKGDLISSGVRVTSTQKSGQELEFFNQQEPKLRYSKSQIETKKRAYFTEASLKSGSKTFPTTGSRKVLLVLASFSDKVNQLTAATFNNVMNESNYNSTGSFRDFYLESSFNQLDLTTTVTVWVQVSNTHAYYGGNDASGNDLRPREFVREAVDSLEAQGFDFSPFDNNGNGFVDGIQVIHAGYGEEYGGADENNIWSHRWSLSSQAVTYDGVIINDYAIYPELRGTSGTNPSNIGVICHEFGHSLGLPDFYDTDYSESGGQGFDLGNWDMMSGGSWNNNGAKPANHNAYSKSMMGWITLEELTIPVQGKTLNNAMENAEASIFHTNTANEFFVIENRQKIGFDSYIPHHGLLIFHVDKNYNGWGSNGINVDPNHQAMDIEEADNTQTSGSTSGDVFPGTSNVTSFTDETSPGSLAWNGGLTAKPITNISENGGVITFDFMYNNGANTPTNFDAIISATNELTLSWVQDQNKNDILLAFSTTNSFGTPINATEYIAGQTIAGGGQVLLADSIELFIHSGLTTNTTYYYQIWSNDGTEYSAPATISILVPTPGDHQLTFQVVDTLDQPLSGALVDLGNDKTSDTNAEGLAVFPLSNGLYNYQVSKTGFITVNDTVSVENGNITENVKLKELKYLVDFTVLNESNLPLNNATIVIDSDITLNTNANGEASVSVYAGTYPYSISFDGYVTNHSEFTVTSANITISDTMYFERYLLTIKVIDKDKLAVDGIDVVLKDVETLITNSAGECTFEHLKQGKYYYSAMRIDFGEASDSLSLASDSTVTLQIIQNGLLTTQSKSYIIYPNPTQGICYIKGAKGAKISVYDAVGRLIMKQEMTDETQELKLHDKPTGEYHIIVNYNKQIESHTLIVE